MRKHFATSNANGEKRFNMDEKCFDRLEKKPTKCIGIKYDRGQMTNYKQYLVYCIKDQLHFLNKNGDECVGITVNFDIDDICWSTSLNQLLILSNKELYSFNLETREMKLLNTFENKWSQCTVNDDTFLVTIGNYKSNIEVYKLDDWKLVKKFEPPLSAKAYQYITQLRFNNSGTKLAVALGGSEKRIFQLRNPSDMTVLESIDLAHINGCTSYYIFPLPNDEFLVHPFLENEILLIDSIGKLKKNILYHGGRIVSTALIDSPSECLVLQVAKRVTTETDDYCTYELHFFDL